MRLHTDTLTSADIYNATDAAARAETGNRAVRPTRMELRGSRQRVRAFDVILTGNNRRGQNGDPHTPAATYDEWGYFLSYLFSRDPGMVAGPYTSAENFHDVTDHRFDPIMSGRGPSIIRD